MPEMTTGPDGKERAQPINDLLEIVAGQLEESIPNVKQFMEASNHDYGCTCEKCWHWWLSAVGPDNVEYDENDEPIPGTGDYGPFGLVADVHEYSTYEDWLNDNG